MVPDPSQEAVELPDGVETLNVFSTRSGASAAVLVSDLPAIEAQVLERVREGLESEEAIQAMLSERLATVDAGIGNVQRERRVMQAALSTLDQEQGG